MNGGAEFRKIIAAYDGSKDSVKAVETAAALASKSGSALTVVHVYLSPVMPYIGAGGMVIPNYGELESAAKESAHRTLAKGVQLAKSLGVEVEGELLEASSIVEGIVEFCANEKADLLVVGTRGMSGFKKLLVGSVSAGVVSHASCPVLVVR